MATNLGGRLSNKDGSGTGVPPGSSRSRPPGRRSDFHTKPVSDLKAMFDKDSAQASSKAFSEPGSDYSKKLDTSKSKSVTTGANTNQNTAKFSSKTGADKSNRRNELSKDDKAAFEALQFSLKKTGVESVISDSVDAPALAVSKVYDGGQTHKATLKSKSSSELNASGKHEVTKAGAASFLSHSLTKIRIRPDSLKKEPLPSSENTSIRRSSSPTLAAKEIRKENKYKPGVTKGWKGNTDESSGRSSPVETNEISPVKFNSSSVGKIRNEAGTQDYKIPGFRSVSPVNKYSSDDSSNSSNLSPRGYTPVVKSDSSVRSGSSPLTVSNNKTDINKNIDDKHISNKPNRANVFTTNQIEDKTKVPNLKLNKAKTETKLSAVEQLNRDKHKIKVYRSSGSFSSDSEKGKISPKMKGSEWMEKSRISLEEFKQKKVLEKQTVVRTSSFESTGSNTSAKSMSKNVTSDRLRSKIERFDSSERRADSRTTGGKDLQGGNKQRDNHSVDLRSDLAVSHRIAPGKFKDLKKGFENPSESKDQSPVRDTKPKIDIKSKHVLERKESFEHPELLRKRKDSEKKEVVSPRQSGKVLQTVHSLNELDTMAKAKLSLKRRSRSLPSSSVDEDFGSSSEWYEDVEHDHGPYYHDIHGVILRDDCSNEGDISSEADQIYEEITTTSNKDTKADRFNRGRSMAMKKRKKLTEEISIDSQAGIEADIDSDSSGNSGIYEPIDHDERVAESDSPTTIQPPALPPDRPKNKKKKKKDGGEKSSKGLTGKLKQLYKGKSLDSETAAGNGDKLKAQNLKNLIMEEHPVCNSEGTDTDGDLDLELQSSSKKSSLERTRSDGSTDNPPPLPPLPPPLPPRHSCIERASTAGTRLSGTDHTYYSGHRLSGSSVEGVPPKSPSGRPASPPLPPRNRVSQNINLDLVVPIAPGGTSASTGDLRKGGWPPSKVNDSYLHGQKISQSISATDLPYMDETSSATTPSPSVSESGVPPLPSRPVVKRPLQQKDSYVCVDGPDDRSPTAESDYSLADEIRGFAGRKELERRPVSSAYIKPSDLSTVPPVSPRPDAPPFDDMMPFQSEYAEEGLYMDLGIYNLDDQSEDQVYGKMGTRYKSKLESESLYQFYNKDKISRASKRKAIYSSVDEESDEDDIYLHEEDVGGERVYEDLTGYVPDDSKSEDKADKYSEKKLSTLEMFGKSGTMLRSLWADMPEVKTSGVLDNITPHERKLQESMFEIISSEATYLKSLNVLISVFLLSEEFGSDMSNRGVLTRQERHVVFSNVGAIRDASEKFLSDLESRWQQSVIISDVCDIMAKHATESFEPYVNYCSNQTFQDRAVTSLKKKMEFVEALKRMESHPDCQGLPMISFLLLPMQRVTRLPLLVDAICHRIDPVHDKDRHNSAVKAFDALHKVTKRCNDGAKKMQQTEQMCLIAKQLDFRNKDMTQIPLISASRSLVKQGELTRIVSETSSRLPFGKAKPGKQATFVFLFSDMLLVTKKKGNQYAVTDYAQRNAIHVEAIDNPDERARLLPLGVPSGCKNMFLCVMLENYDKKTVEFVFSCNSMSDRARWLDAMTPVKVSDEQERIYEEWDCPQVQCMTKYTATENDELTLDEADVVNVFKKLDDGWFEGERMRDGERGWFPANNTVEIVNSHVRARNMRMRYRLMAAAEHVS